ncbi:hypothetical protein AC579_1322 [Pseudocercospora musae]|uniref:Uncharacterized protein n=1 Tax=Pseudocercospora musae TaxID=113226 RepID=A0A139IP69_9PEZI|nr:hypothetical protein AC579_1322 [Pseudocercospora musae]
MTVDGLEPTQSSTAARGLQAIATPSALKVLASSAISRGFPCISSHDPRATTTIPSAPTASTSTSTATPTGTYLATPVSNAKMQYFCGGNDVGLPSSLDIGTTCPGPFSGFVLLGRMDAKG